MADDARPFEPTSRKLRLARERGEIARTPLLAAGAAFAAAAAAIALGAPRFVSGWSEAARALLSGEPSVEAGVEIAAAVGAEAIAWPLGAAVLAAAVVGVAQAGGLFAPRAIRIDPSRLDPSAGLRRLVEGPRVVSQLGRLGLALGFALLGAWAIHEALAGTLGRVDLGPRLALGAAAAVLGGLAWRAAIALLVAGGLAHAYARWAHRHRLRMSRRERLEEERATRGDPAIRRRRETRRRALVMGPGLAEVAKDAALLVEGERALVAIGWDGGDGAPTVAAVARGSALAVLRRSPAPRLRDLALAAQLAAREPGAPVPRAAWPRLARAIAEARAT